MSLPPLLAGLCGEGVMLDWLSLSLALTVIAFIRVMASRLVCRCATSARRLQQIERERRHVETELRLAQWQLQAIERAAIQRLLAEARRSS